VLLEAFIKGSAVTGVMSTCRWHGGALLAGRSRRGNGNDGYGDAEPQSMRTCAEVELTLVSC